MERLKKLAAVGAAAAILAVVPAGTAGAKITCENPGGNAPPGQQDKCQGPHQNVNPSGHAPPGHNK